MVEIAPRYDPRIVEAVRALDDRNESMAEIARRVGRVACSYGLPKPSYVHLRRLILVNREEEDYLRARRAAIREIAVDVYVDAMRGRMIDPWEVEARIRAAGA